MVVDPTVLQCIRTAKENLCRDATCVDTFNVTSVIDAAVIPCVAAMRAEERKRALYSSLKDGYIFEPVDHLDFW